MFPDGVVLDLDAASVSEEHQLPNPEEQNSTERTSSNLEIGTGVSNYSYEYHP